MLRIKRCSQAGSAEKSDVLVVMEPREPRTGTKVAVKSPVLMEFGRHMVATVESVLKEQGIVDVAVMLEDKGALEFALRARCETALRRALME